VFWGETRRIRRRHAGQITTDAARMGQAIGRFYAKVPFGGIHRRGGGGTRGGQSTVLPGLAPIIRLPRRAGERAVGSGVAGRWGTGRNIPGTAITIILIARRRIGMFQGIGGMDPAGVSTERHVRASMLLVLTGLVPGSATHGDA